jgi:hypothetical protein
LAEQPVVTLNSRRSTEADIVVENIIIRYQALWISRVAMIGNDGAMLAAHN